MVTGAASGIGAGLASHFVSLGDRVIALDMDSGGLVVAGRSACQSKSFASCRRRHRSCAAGKGVG